MRWVIILPVIVFLSCSQTNNKENAQSKQEEKWYILSDKEYGPINLQELEKWCEEGRILPNTLVRKGSHRYKSAKNFSELQEILTKSTSPNSESLEEEIPLIPNVTYGLQPKEE